MKKSKKQIDNVTSFEDFFKESMKIPSVKKAYDEQELERTLRGLIIEARIKKHVTQKILADKMGTKQSSIARFESGRSNPTLSFVQKLVLALDVKIKITT